MAVLLSPDLVDKQTLKSNYYAGDISHYWLSTLSVHSSNPTGQCHSIFVPFLGLLSTRLGFVFHTNHMFSFLFYCLCFNCFCSTNCLIFRPEADRHGCNWRYLFWRVVACYGIESNRSRYWALSYSNYTYSHYNSYYWTTLLFYRNIFHNRAVFQQV